MIEVQFFGRRSNAEGDLGPHLRGNLKAGHFKLSPTVLTKCGIEKGDKVNLAYLYEEGNFQAAYMAKEERGLKIGDKGMFTSEVHAKDMREAFGDRMEAGHDIVILSVDVDNPQEANGGEYTVWELTFQESQAAKAAPRKKSKKEKVEAVS